MKMRKTLPVRNGFTLLELMVAFAIMAMSLGLIYRAMGSSASNTPGVALAEVYDLSAPAVGQKLFNIDC